MNEKIKIQILDQKYTLGKQIGKGQHGSVFLVNEQDEQKKSACVIKTETSKNRALKEVNAINLFYKPFKTALCEGKDHKGNAIFYFSMPFFEGSTLKDLQKKGLTLYEKMVIAYQLQAQLKKLHECGLLHRDIKADNIMVNINGPEISVNIIDLGRSAFLKNKDTLLLQTPKLLMFFQKQVAPEFFRNEASQIGTYSDIYSFGTIFKSLFPGDMKTINQLTGTSDIRENSFKNLEDKLSMRFDEKIQEFNNQINTMIDSTRDITDDEIKKMHVAFIQLQSVVTKADLKNSESLKDLAAACNLMSDVYRKLKKEEPGIFAKIKAFFAELGIGEKSKEKLLEENVKNFGTSMKL